MTFHSVGNFIIPTDELHHFSEGLVYHQPAIVCRFPSFTIYVKAAARQCFRLFTSIHRKSVSKILGPFVRKSEFPIGRCPFETYLVDQSFKLVESENSI